MAYRLKYCVVHDALWETDDLCTHVFLERELAGKYHQLACDFIYLKAEVDRA